MLYVTFMTIGDVPKGSYAMISKDLQTSLKKYVKLEHRVVKSADDLADRLSKEEYLIVLDAAGKSMTSEAFAAYLKVHENQGDRITVILGGPFGLPDEIKNSADLLLSLSPMTTTHDLAHLFFLEQLFRACSINHGSAYHK